MTKFKVHLPDAMETSMIMLYGLAADARSAPSILADKVAAAAFDKVDYDLDRLKSKVVSGKSMRVKVAVRAKFFDGWTRDFLAAHDKATVVQLGAGLDSRVWRIDPSPEVQWFDVDLPGVVEAREQIFPGRDNYRLIPASVTDPQWLDEVPADDPVLVVAQGVTMYLDPEAGRAMFRRIAERFPSGTIVMDTHNAFGVRSVNRMLKRQFGKEMLTWPIEDEHELAEAVPNLRCVEVVSSLSPDLLDDLPPRLVPPGSRLMCRAVQHIRPLRTMSQYLRYEF
ncbi:MAG TPA: class I SAM-dependent methyltransferase [Stackebrandtia sp.]|jgi:methyltransferase (TIGR00027 family)|uniref:class I SAM-dependent methyltransferase n=1 Tax=Stackebrandtia sp. TaxID=2023065 RepID=UPI002D4ADBD3|nr:class I SAM-dependent methyltransferase [Stackebrandtia sp.]HZE37560.1 class I SAM-dependent methyltransferase [Stackebrandtia sp.]